MKWYNKCNFCDLYSGKHHKDCLWHKTLRAAQWSQNGLVIIPSAKSNNIAKTIVIEKWEYKTSEIFFNPIKRQYEELLINKKYTEINND